MATVVGDQRLRAFVNSRWLVFVVSMWIQCCAGVGYMFGSISPLIKSAMGYNQKEVGVLSVAKNLGDCIGFIAGALSEILPFWAILAIGAVQNFVGYGFVWLIVTNRLPKLPIWVLCIALFVGNNGETYYNTAALVSCVQNFPRSRGPIVGILKGFSGLSGAILGHIYHMFSSTNQNSLILMIAVGPPIVILSLMFIVRSVDGLRQIRRSDGLSFTFVYGICLLLAAYLMGFLLLEDLTTLSRPSIIVCSAILFFILLLPLILPVTLAFFPETSTTPIEENLLPKDQAPESSKLMQVKDELIVSEIQSEDEITPEIEQVAHNQATKLVQAAAEGAVLISRKGPRRGEDFTLQQALVKADLWLIFVSLVLAAGSGVTIIDNMGQMCQSLGYYDTRIFVSMISIWNFLGRVGGGYFSELVVKNYTYPRPVALAIVQVIMAIGLLYYALGGPAAIYVTTLLIGLGYGALWGIAPAAVSELFGLKSFGALYNFLTLAMPIGSFIFSGVLASSIYDYYAEMQAEQPNYVDLSLLKMQLGAEDNSLICTGTICYSITCAILSGVALIAAVLSLIVVRRTRSVYVNLYGNPPC